MLLNEISRHRGLVGVFILLFIGLPMLFFIQGQVSVADFFRTGPSNPPVAMVGETPVTANEFAQAYMRVQDERSRFGQSATAADLLADGTVDYLMETLIQEKLVVEKTKGEPIRPGRVYLEERLRKFPDFLNERGEFDPGLYNRWVEANTRGGVNWDAIYESVSETVNHENFMKLAGAAVRVPESEVRRQFFDQNTRMRVKAAAVSPKIEITEEELRAYYDAHLDEFMTPEERTAEYVAISTKAPQPPLVQELIDRANAGEDFAELARQHSAGVDADAGGDLGWITDSPALRDHEKPIFEMQVGEVRGPIESFFGLHIYKLEETRENPEGLREVHARQIVIRPELTDEERTAREEQARTLAAKAAEGRLDLAALAAQEGLELKTAGRLNDRTQEIEGMDQADVLQFRTAVFDLEIGKISGVITAMRNLYLAEVTEIVPPEQRTFEEARESVQGKAELERRQSAEYRQLANEFVGKIAAQAKSLDDMKTMFPELEVEVKETDSFGLNDQLFNQGLIMDGRTLMSRIVNKNPGDFVGPIYDMLQVPHFIEVVERTAPEGETWEEQYTQEKERIRKDLIRMRRMQLQADYMQHLRTQFVEAALVQQDDERIYSILRLDEKAESASTEATQVPAVQSTVNQEAAEAVATPVIEGEPAPSDAEAPEAAEEPAPTEP